MNRDQSGIFAVSPQISGSILADSGISSNNKHDLFFCRFLRFSFLCKENVERTMITWISLHKSYKDIE